MIVLTSGHLGAGMTIAEIRADYVRLSDVVTQSQHLGELARKARRFKKAAQHHEVASEAASRVFALQATYGHNFFKKAVDRSFGPSNAFDWVDRLMHGFRQTDKGWERTTPQQAERSGALQGVAGGFTC